MNNSENKLFTELVAIMTMTMTMSQSLIPTMSYHIAIGSRQIYSLSPLISTIRHHISPHWDTTSSSMPSYLPNEPTQFLKNATLQSTVQYISKLSPHAVQLATTSLKWNEPPCFPISHHISVMKWATIFSKWVAMHIFLIRHHISVMTNEQPHLPWRFSFGNTF